MQNPSRLAAVGAVEIDFENFAPLGLDEEVIAMAAALPIFFRRRAGEPPIVPGRFDGDDPILLLMPDEGYRLGGGAFTENRYSFANKGRHIPRGTIFR